MDTHARLLPLNVVARRLRVPLRWLRAEAEAGRVPCLSAGGRILCDTEAVEAALLQRAEGGRTMTYTVRDIMELYRVSQATVLHWLATGQLKALNVGRDPGKRRARYRITETQLAEFELVRTSNLEPVAPRRRRKQTDDIVRVYGGW